MPYAARMRGQDRSPAIASIARPSLVAAALIFVSTFVTLFPYRNQNTYLIHARASEQFGGDWLTKTVDPFPIATVLSRMLLSLGQFGLALGYFLCVAAFATAASMIVRINDDQRSQPSIVLGCAIALPWIVVPLIGANLHGVAEQYILGGVWQPSELGGAGLVLAIAFHVAGRSIAAPLAIGTAIWLHPGSAMAGAIIMGAIVARLVLCGKVGLALKSGLICLTACIPALAVISSSLGGDPPEVVQQAQELLVHHRMPHHALPSVWISPQTVLQVVLVALGVIVLRRQAALAFILGAAALTSIALTSVAIWIDQDWMYLLFPWRVFSVLVPLSCSLICVQVLAPFGQRLRAGTGWGVVALALLVSVVSHARNQINSGIQFIDRRSYGLWVAASANIIGPSQPLYLERAQAELLKWAREKGPDNTGYVVPPDLEIFRMFTGHPIFADWKSHPYKPSELVDWFDRVRIVAAFYDSPPCSYGPLADTMLQGYRVIVYPASSACRERGQVVFENDGFVVIERD